MFVPVRITVNGTANYDRGFDLAGKRLLAFKRAAEDMTEPLTAIGETIVTSVAATMAAQGAGAWPGLSTPYGPWKQKHVAGVPMLVGLRPLHKGTREHPTRPETYGISGAMAKSLLNRSEALHIEPQRMLYAPTSPIAGYHEDGTTKMPARPPLALTAAMLHSFDREFVTWINDLVQESERA
jgi:hypothetical protein